MQDLKPSGSINEVSKVYQNVSCTSNAFVADVMLMPVRAQVNLVGALLFDVVKQLPGAAFAISTFAFSSAM